jgi:hypothetical protein
MNMHDLAFVAMLSKGSTSASKAASGWHGRGCLSDTGDRIVCSQDQLPVINGKTHPDVDLYIYQWIIDIRFEEKPG